MRVAVAGLSSGSAPALARAIEALARRQRSAHELERWLADRNYPEDEIAVTVEHLSARGLLNDAEYAKSFVRSRLLGRGQSRRRIQGELARRGISRELANAAISDVMAADETTDAELVERAALKKLRSLGKLDPEVRRRRLHGFLARQGFPAGIARETAERLLRST